jgi:hypothetical protein
MDSLFSLHRKYRLTARCSPHASRLLSITVLGLTISSIPLYADHNHGGSSWDRKSDQHWVGTWATSPEAGTVGFSNQTLRLIVHTSVGGDEVRVRISNAYGTTSLVIGAVHIALRSTGAQIASGSDRALTFSSQPSIAIPPGALIVSDPVRLNIPALGEGTWRWPTPSTYRCSASTTMQKNTVLPSPQISHPIRNHTFIAG